MSEQTTNLTFSTALDALKQGKSVTHLEWKLKGMYLEMTTKLFMVHSKGFNQTVKTPFFLTGK